jgi:hypothetical protein
MLPAMFIIKVSTSIIIREIDLVLMALVRVISKIRGRIKYY